MSEVESVCLRAQVHEDTYGGNPQLFPDALLSRKCRRLLGACGAGR